jgi:hypothetical protein
MQQPCANNNYLVEHAVIIRTSYARLFGKELLPAVESDEEFAKQLFYVPFAVVSHNTDEDPVFNYANLKAMELFEFGWEEFTRLPSRLSAEPVNRPEREKLLAEVARHGYINHYQGVRIAKSGRRFLIKNATVWNLSDQLGCHSGQAACFDQWQFL